MLTRCLPAMAVCVLSAAFETSSAEVLDKIKNVSGTSLQYKVILPQNYDSARVYPAVLAFPGGPQTMNIVDSTVERNWRGQAEKRGYIVIVPAAPDGDLFFEKGARVFPEFLKLLLAEYKIADNKFHIAGNSNGGISAFYIAAAYPQYFLSVTGFPGFLPDATPARIHALDKMCVFMYVGELDTDWLDSMRTQANQFRDAGLKVQFTVEKDQHHLINTLTGNGAARLFDDFEAAHHGCPAH